MPLHTAAALSLLLLLLLLQQTAVAFEIRLFSRNSSLVKATWQSSVAAAGGCVHPMARPQLRQVMKMMETRDTADAAVGNYHWFAAQLTEGAPTCFDSVEIEFQDEAEYNFGAGVEVWGFPNPSELESDNCNGRRFSQAFAEQQRTSIEYCGTIYRTFSISSSKVYCRAHVRLLMVRLRAVNYNWNLTRSDTGVQNIVVSPGASLKIKDIVMHQCQSDVKYLAFQSGQYPTEVVTTRQSSQAPGACYKDLQQQQQRYNLASGTWRYAATLSGDNTKHWLAMQLRFGAVIHHLEVLYAPYGISGLRLPDAPPDKCKVTAYISSVPYLTQLPACDICNCNESTDALRQLYFRRDLDRREHTDLCFVEVSKFVRTLVLLSESPYGLAVSDVRVKLHKPSLEAWRIGRSSSGSGIAVAESGIGYGPMWQSSAAAGGCLASGNWQAMDSGPAAAAAAAAGDGDSHWFAVILHFVALMSVQLHCEDPKCSDAIGTKVWSTPEAIIFCSNSDSVCNCPGMQRRFEQKLRDDVTRSIYLCGVVGRSQSDFVTTVTCSRLTRTLVLRKNTGRAAKSRMKFKDLVLVVYSTSSDREQQMFALRPDYPEHKCYSGRLAAVEYRGVWHSSVADPRHCFAEEKRRSSDCYYNIKAGGGSSSSSSSSPHWIAISLRKEMHFGCFVTKADETRNLEMWVSRSLFDFGPEQCSSSKIAEKFHHQSNDFSRCPMILKFNSPFTMMLCNAWVRTMVLRQSQFAISVSRIVLVKMTLDSYDATGSTVNASCIRVTLRNRTGSYYNFRIRCSQFHKYEPLHNEAVCCGFSARARHNVSVMADSHFLSSGKVVTFANRFLVHARTATEKPRTAVAVLTNRSCVNVTWISDTGYRLFVKFRDHPELQGLEPPLQLCGISLQADADLQVAAQAEGFNRSSTLSVRIKAPQPAAAVALMRDDGCITVTWQAANISGIEYFMRCQMVNLKVLSPATCCDESTHSVMLWAKVGHVNGQIRVVQVITSRSRRDTFMWYMSAAALALLVVALFIAGGVRSILRRRTMDKEVASRLRESRISGRQSSGKQSSGRQSIKPSGRQSIRRSIRRSRRHSESRQSRRLSTKRSRRFSELVIPTSKSQEDANQQQRQCRSDTE